MRHLALAVIHDEQQALAAMLRSMSLLVDQARREGHAPDFAVLRAMLFYVDECPERLHHPKESKRLLPQVRARCPELGPTLDRLDADHGHSEAARRRGGEAARRRSANSNTRCWPTKCWASAGSKPSPRQWSAKSTAT